MKIHAIHGIMETIYLAEYPEGLLLLDTGCRVDVALIESFVTGTLGRSMSDILAAVVTHAHPDHAGGARILKRRYSIPIAAHSGIDRWYSGFRGSIQHIVDIILAGYVIKKKKRKPARLWYPKKVKPDIILDDGDTIPGFGEWRVLLAPGHTSHDLILFHEPSRVLYAADLIIAVKGTPLLPFPITMPERMKNSLDKAEALAPSSFLLAHGGAITFTDPAREFNLLRDRISDYGNDRFPLLYLVTRISREIIDLKAERD